MKRCIVWEVCIASSNTNVISTFTEKGKAGSDAFSTDGVASVQGDSERVEDSEEEE